ncbi:hypothetical protein SDC9_58334 [bioreactor metagenome]|uniref:Secretion system C-terminal sorting domain-containing protein n=1 Tax=bioreactor metagenome TaxID=1076179 RepID=A0A644XCR5_9ZZZZ
MSRIISSVLLIALLAADLCAQTVRSGQKQTNVTGKDVMADMPWRMQKNNQAGNPNGLPVLVYIKDADVIGANADVVYIDISIKNADDASFGNPITFSSYSDSAFLSLFSCKSTTDAAFGVQDFDSGLPVKDASHTIQFTSDYSSLFNIHYTRVDQEFWYFVFTVPAEMLAGFDDIIDVKVYFSLDWEADDELYFRVFRYNDPLPSLPGYCRGDAHYHTMYTNNSAEYGCPAEATKEMAQYIGLDWIAATNHSCDYDNYGVDIQQNRSRERNEIQLINSQDSSMIFLHALEASNVNNEDNVVHMLCYPDPANPLQMPFIGDGNGDLSSTDVSIDDALAVLQQCNGFAFAAHPFATGDKLSALISGGIWNIGDAAFPVNGDSIPGHDVVICNDPVLSSDLYSTNASELFKDNLLGGQIWNYRNSVYTTDESFNPWDVLYDSGTDMFSIYNIADITEHTNRLLPGLEVSKFFWKKGLQLKNANNAVQNYRFFISAGTDAHGDFNYCNTNFVYGVTGDISDDALGKLTSLTYCPGGKGSNGSNILSAMQSGHIVLSDGPVVGISLDLNGSPGPEFVGGDEVLMSYGQYSDADIVINAASSDEFGRLDRLRLILGTEDGEIVSVYHFSTYTTWTEFVVSLDSLVQAAGNIDINEYFYLRAELSTDKQYGVYGPLYGKTSEIFRSYTNPLWVVRPDSASGLDDDENMQLRVFPVPFKDQFYVEMHNSSDEKMNFTICDAAGKIVFEEEQSVAAGQSRMALRPDLQRGVYFLTVHCSNGTKTMKLIKE